jgi:Xaa-Pro dipeptidase
MAGNHLERSANEREARILATRVAMRERGLQMLLLVGPENIYYLLGLNHQGYFAFTLAVLPVDGPPLLVTRAMEQATVASQVAGCVHLCFADDEDPADAALRAISMARTSDGPMGVEQQTMFWPMGVWHRIRDGLPNARWVDGSGIVEALRAVKSETEIAWIRRAAAASDRAMQAGIAVAREGVSEREIAATIYEEMILGGSEYPGFAPLIRTTRNLHQEHVTWSDHRLEHADLLFMELSASVARYHAPLTRMMNIGIAPTDAVRAAELALAGLEAIRSSLRPGAAAGEVYAAWQEVVDHGLGHRNYRRHHCGYMIGIGFPPSWVGGSAVVGLRQGGDLIIREGMVFHILSWILGQLGADHGLSDTALVTASGCELLTTTSRTPLVIS